MLIFSSCGNSQREKAYSILQEWEQKEILFPSQSVFTIQGRDTVKNHLLDKYKIVIYTDSIGCTNCKLQLPKWAEFIQLVDSLCPEKAQFLFYFTPNKKMEINRILLENRFKYPVCIDKQDSINTLNHFPTNTALQTFLLDNDNKVLVVGNPVHNPKIQELYLKVLKGENLKSESVGKPETNIMFERTSADMGVFDWKKEQCVDFVGVNTGDELLVVEDVVTSCGCTTVEYPKEPIQQGEKLILKVKYRAEHPERFNKTITVYCNAKGSPFKLQVIGNAE